MLDRLPVLLDPLSFSERGKKLVGSIKISELTRLSDVLVNDFGLVDIDFSFDKEGRVPTLTGQIKANLILQCQACLEQVELPINKHFKLGMVTSLEQADRLASDCEPLMLESEKISVNDLVEDELLLALPDFPRHKEQCVEENEEGINDDNKEQLNSNNPFSVLAEFKNTGD
ncbi:MAG: metal-binding protein [Methylococcales symbiont of Hymedesmia sp. n. MRB-2018]|nr:MAG: metal-binding protein [Methylococcales symbiont of Hymedesmia sp. n. MRB-2018]KAF3983083.1 MAG: metal-binding protein [Methylococcales symbiont of Hymedesmia sp. n. MRB-2018]